DCSLADKLSRRKRLTARNNSPAHLWAHGNFFLSPDRAGDDDLGAKRPLFSWRHLHQHGRLLDGSAVLRLRLGGKDPKDSSGRHTKQQQNQKRALQKGGRGGSGHGGLVDTPCRETPSHSNDERATL